MQPSYEDSSFEKTPVQKSNTESQNLSPVKQIKMGVKPEDVRCKDNYKLVLGMTEKSPAACLRQNTAFCLESTSAACSKSTYASGRPPYSQAEGREVTLRTNTLQGISPLTIGFLLIGTDKQFESKTWFFGDDSQEGPTFNNIENHVYSYNFDNTTDISHTFYGHVDVSEYQYGIAGKLVTTKQFNVTVLKNTNKYISNFNQYQGVILKGDSTAFSIATSAKSWTGWNFEKSMPTVAPEEPYSQSEHHKYNAVGIINGNVSATPITGRVENVTEYWNFSVLVIPKTTTTVEIVEREGSGVPESGKDEWHVNKQIKFYVNRNTSSNGRPAPGTDVPQHSFKWNFGDNTETIITHGDEWPSHKYKESGSYLVKCDATFENNLKFQLSKTVNIIP